jgi:hypothetical protein
VLEGDAAKELAADDLDTLAAPLDMELAINVSARTCGATQDRESETSLMLCMVRLNRVWAQQIDTGTK